MRSSTHAQEVNLVTPQIIILRLKKEIIKLKEIIKQIEDENKKK